MEDNSETSVTPTDDQDIQPAEGAAIEAAPEAGDPPVDANSDISSPSETQDAKEPKSVLDAVKAAVNADKEGEASSVSEEGESKPKAKEEAKSDAGKDEAKAEEDGEADIPKEFHEHPRWKKLKSERDDFKQRLESYEPKAEQYEKIAQYTQENNISGEDFQQAMSLAALLNTDPAKGIEALESTLERFKVASGQALPGDLQDRVDSGYLSEEDAKALSDARIQAQANGQRAEKSEATLQQERVQAVQNTVTQWEASLAQDPDYQKKRDFILSELNSIHAREGVATSSDAALDQCKRAKAAVDERLAGIMPRQQARPPVPGASRAASTQSSPQPNSVREAVFAAANGGLAG